MMKGINDHRLRRYVIAKLGTLAPKGNLALKSDRLADNPTVENVLSDVLVHVDSALEIALPADEGVSLQFAHSDSFRLTHSV